MTYISFALVFLIMILIFKLFKFKTKTIITLLINILVGGVVLYFINYIPGISIAIDIWKALAVGAFGLPAVIVILVLELYFK